MNREKTAVFIGHGDCPLSVEAVKPYIEKEILNGIDTFLNGGQGGFDYICARAVYQLKGNYPEIKSILVVPYHSFKVFDETLFDEIISPNIDYDSNIAYKSAIPKRNSFMIENASTAICYVTHISGGAYNTFKLAKKKKLRVINISDELNRQSYERKDIMQTKFIAVTTDLLALAYLSQKSGSSYDISKFIEEHSAEETALSQSTVFTSLYKLNQNGYVQSETVTTETGRQREIYSILPEGEAYYKSFLNDYNRHIKSVNQVLSVLIKITKY